jgi:hypothetical protein
MFGMMVTQIVVCLECKGLKSLREWWRKEDCPVCLEEVTDTISSCTQCRCIYIFCFVEKKKDGVPGEYLL